MSNLGRRLLYDGILEFIFLERDSLSRAQYYSVEFWSCDDPVVICRREIFSNLSAALDFLGRNGITIGRG
jgi:hypothetical protein